MHLKLYVLEYEVNEVGEEVEIDRYIDCWIDENEIKGFYSPLDNDEIKCLNLFINGTNLTVIQKPELVEYLNRRFNVTKTKERKMNLKIKDKRP